MAQKDPDISALAAYAGKYEQQLYAKMINGTDFARQLRVLPNVKNSVNMTNLRVQDGIRPYSDIVTASGNDLAYEPRKLTVGDGKRELLISPQKYRQTFMSESMRPGFNPMEIPFAAFTWGEVMKSVGAELNDKTIWHGFDKSTATAYSGSATYTAGDYITVTTGDKVDFYKCLSNTTAGESPSTAAAKWQLVNAEAVCKGLGTIIAEEIAASNLTAEAIGAITSTAGDALTSFRQLFRSQSDANKMRGVTIFCSFTDYELLLDDVEKEVSKYTRDDVSAGFVLPGTGNRCRVEPATWITNSRRMICTPPENIVVGTDLLSDMQRIRTKENLWTLEAGIAFSLGVQIRDLQEIRINDQA